MSNNAQSSDMSGLESRIGAILSTVEPVSDVRRRGMLFILSSPSGAGKTTLSRLLMRADTGLSMSVSATTRAARPGEVEARDYYFVTQERFAEMVAQGEMLEHAQVFDNAYGSPRGPVEAALKAGRDVLFDVDWQGARQIKSALKDDVVAVFILPPSLAALETRLRTRAQDDEATVQRRMAKARDEIEHWDEYDHVLVNDDLEKCAVQLATVLAAERLRLARRREGLAEFVKVIGEVG